VVKNIVNLDFRCKFVGGELTTSDESPEVGWFSPAQAVEAVTDPLIKLRFMNMLEGHGMVHIINFVKEPFRVVSQIDIPV